MNWYHALVLSGGPDMKLSILRVRSSNLYVIGNFSRNWYGICIREVHTDFEISRNLITVVDDITSLFAEESFRKDIFTVSSIKRKTVCKTVSDNIRCITRDPFFIRPQSYGLHISCI